VYILYEDILWKTLQFVEWNNKIKGHILVTISK